MKIDSSWEKLIEDKIEENNNIFLTHSQFEQLIKDITRHPQSPILTLRYEIKSGRKNYPFNTYKFGVEGKGILFTHYIKIKDNRDSLCTIMYWCKYENSFVSDLKNLLQLLFESFWKPTFRTPSAGLADLKREERVLIVARNTLKVYAERNIITSVLFCDLDNFKKINDSHGHEYGDLVILKIGSIIESVSRMDAIALHNGGDEFILIIPMEEQKNINKLISNINDKIKEFNLTMSVGISTTESCSTGILFDNLLRQADEDLLYNVKKKKK